MREIVAAIVQNALSYWMDKIYTTSFDFMWTIYSWVTPIQKFCMNKGPIINGYEDSEALAIPPKRW